MSSKEKEKAMNHPNDNSLTGQMPDNGVPLGRIPEPENHPQPKPK